VNTSPGSHVRSWPSFRYCLFVSFLLPSPFLPSCLFLLFPFLLLFTLSWTKLMHACTSQMYPSFFCDRKGECSALLVPIQRIPPSRSPACLLAFRAPPPRLILCPAPPGSVHDHAWTILRSDFLSRAGQEGQLSFLDESLFRLL